MPFGVTAAQAAQPTDHPPGQCKFSHGVDCGIDHKSSKRSECIDLSANRIKRTSYRFGFKSAARACQQHHSQVNYDCAHTQQPSLEATQSLSEFDRSIGEIPHSLPSIACIWLSIWLSIFKAQSQISRFENKIQLHLVKRSLFAHAHYRFPTTRCAHQLPSFGKWHRHSKTEIPSQCQLMASKSKRNRSGSRWVDLWSHRATMISNGGMQPSVGRGPFAKCMWIGICVSNRVTWFRFQVAKPNRIV